MSCQSNISLDDGGASRSVETLDGDDKIGALSSGSQSGRLSFRGRSRDRSKGRNNAARSGSEYGSADASESAECSIPMDEKDKGEGNGVFVASAPVGGKPGPRSSEGSRKRSGSVASVASSTEDVAMEVDLTECDPTTKRAREDGYASDASAHSGSSRSPRGRGRPPATGDYVGLAAAKAAANKMETEELMIRADRELLDSWTEPSVTRARRVLLGVADTPADGSEESQPDPSSLSAADLAGQLQKSVEVMNTVASYRKGYKSTSPKVLREVAGVVSAVRSELLGRTQDDESRRLRAANARLSAEVGELRRQLEELRKRVANMAGSKELAPPLCPTQDPPLTETSSPPLPQRKRPRRNAEEVTDPTTSSSSTHTSGREREGGSQRSPEKVSKEVPDLGAEAIINAIANRVAEFVNARFAAIEK